MIARYRYRGRHRARRLARVADALLTATMSGGLLSLVIALGVSL